ncbi:MAG: hypothetical protein MUE82_08085 [Chloroflexi bacterium]|nr:hypothetical protein [Chloroflexota bacterium]
MTDDRRGRRGATGSRRLHRTTDHTDLGRSTTVHTPHGIVAQAIHADRTRESAHPTRRTWMEARTTGRRRPALRARLGRSIVRIGERIAADPVLTPVRSR